MTSIGTIILGIVERIRPELLRVSEAEAGVAPGPQRWSPKEILGHLVDSAMNNHVRIIRAHRQTDLVFDGYAQNAWVDIQGYAERPWSDLVDLWSHQNRHLAFISSPIPQFLPALRVQSPRCSTRPTPPIARPPRGGSSDGWPWPCSWSASGRASPWRRRAAPGSWP